MDQRQPQPNQNDATPPPPTTAHETIRHTRIAAAWLCFMTILFDGYDTAVISFAAPSLAHDWSLPAAAFTPAFVATSLGAVIGYLSCGTLAAKFGHRRLVIASVGFFGLMSLATVLATTITELTIFRFITALGLGGAIPTAIALASGHADNRRRELTASIVTVAIVIGSTLGGLVSVPILRRWGWQGPFVLGAILPILFVPALIAWLPDTATRGGHGSPKALFTPAFALPTMLLWAMAFLSFMQSYSFTYWLPLLLTSFGFDRASAALGNTYIGAGGIAGVILMACFVQRVGSARYLAGAFVVGAGFVLLIAFGGLPNETLPALLFLTGAGLGIGGVGQAAIGAMLYPASVRTTGVGWSSAMGRIGSILGPGIAGAFLHLEWPARSIVALAALPALAAAAAAFAIFVLTRRRTATEDQNV
jgi:AAHS family 4-hydroxybenzoate transporter-like MFS transporter